MTLKSNSDFGVGCSKNLPLENQEKKFCLDNSSNKDFFSRSDDVVRLETSIKDRFKVLLTRLGRSQNWLADEVGISHGTMSRIANGEWFPASQVMIRICEILEVQSVALFGDSKYWKNWSDKINYLNGEKKND